MKPWMTMTALAALVMVTACSSEKVEVLKSPCVGLEGSPCGPKRPLNGNFNHESLAQPQLKA
jgi:hypothetical protein